MGLKKGVKSGIYIPVNEDKWIITKTFDTKEPCIKYRSSWEKKFMEFCDFNPNITKVNSEGMTVKYLNPVTNKISNYYMDFMIETNNNKIWLVEVKPRYQTIPPKPPKNNSEKSAALYRKAIQTYAVNQAKWEATEILCEEKGWIFKIITEKELGL